MLKAKLCTLAIACTVGFLVFNPRTAFAAETDTESVTLSEIENGHKDREAAYDDKMKEVYDSWNALTKKQKNEIYSLLELELNAEIKVMDKLAEYKVLDKEDAETIKSRMKENFKRAKENSDFPFGRPKGPKSSK